MGMGSFESKADGGPMSDINTTPLVDVMLVLLVIFIITAPLMTRAISLDLPESDASVVTTPADTINISIKANGSLFIDQAEVSQNELETVFSKAAAASKKTPVHLRAEKDTRYEDVLNVMSLANRMGLSQIGFVTQAERSPAAAR